MKKLKKFAIILLSIAIVASVLCSCSNSSGKAVSYVDSEYSKSISTPEYSDISNEDKSIAYNQKLVKKFNIDMDTKSFDETLEKLKHLITGYGYVSNSSVQQSTSRYSEKYASFTFRVDSERVDQFVEEIGKLGSVTRSTSTVEDITKMYYDLESQMNALIDEKSNFEALRKGADYATLIKIEDKIASLTSQINYLNSQIEYYKNSISYSFVYLNVHEVKEYVVKEETFWDEIGNTFKDSFKAFVSVLHGFLNVLIYILPFAAVLGIVAIIVIVCTKKNRKKKAAEKEQNTTEQQS